VVGHDAAGHLTFSSTLAGGSSSMTISAAATELGMPSLPPRPIAAASASPTRPAIPAPHRRRFTTRSATRTPSRCTS
jgi:hypothetical protein